MNTNVIPIDRYAVVPAVLPGELPPITRADAQRIASAIVRNFYPTKPRKYGGRIRRVWISPKPTAADNHSKGLGRLIHDLSHRAFRRVYPQKRPHDPLHVRYEADIAAFVAERLPKLVRAPAVKAKPSLDEKRARALVQTEAAISRWESKQKRARNALRKLETKRRRIMKLLRGDER